MCVCVCVCVCVCGQTNGEKEIKLPTQLSPKSFGHCDTSVKHVPLHLARSLVSSQSDNVKQKIVPLTTIHPYGSRSPPWATICSTLLCVGVFTVMATRSGGHFSRSEPGMTALSSLWSVEVTPRETSACLKCLGCWREISKLEGLLFRVPLCFRGM